MRRGWFGRSKREARVKRSTVDEQAAGESPTSTRCRFCGCEEGASDAQAVREKSHLQVVVACGSCGHPFAVLSRN
jgi:transcription elongation factor Elf1